MTKREYCEHLNKLQDAAIELRVRYGEYGDFDEKLEDAICAIRAAIKALIPDGEQIGSDKHRPQRPPTMTEYETPSFKENDNAPACPMCGKTLDRYEKLSCWACHSCRVFFRSSRFRG